ncbi:heavy metal translocating P-type ATPase [Roseburia inulinivorans]|jgi:heavy metal translocating P-type ATPase
MKFIIKHETKGRMRIHAVQNRMSYAQADTLLYFLHSRKEVTFAKVYDRTCDAVISYVGDRQTIIELLRGFHYEDVEVPEGLIENSGRELNNTYQEKLIGKIVFHYARRWILPYPIRICLTSIQSVKYLWKGLTTLAAGRIEVPVLDATAIGVSVLRSDFNTAGSIMFMLGIGELLEEWTHKKSVDDLARTMSLNVGKVWLVSGGQEVLVPTSQIKAGDKVVVHMGNIIPFDGVVAEGEAMVNQASLTGESVPVRKTVESTAYAGTVVEEGELTILVKEVGGSSRFEKIVKMIEDSEKLKSGAESKAEHLADKLVPYSLGGTILTYLLTRNVTKALSILMVDYSCALKLAMPISVLSAIREASLYNVTVKGGKYLEAVAEADTIVFDKTGTLTKAKPTVVDVVSFNGESTDELLRIAACLEEHFPHSMAKAVVDAATQKNLEHEEMHSKVEYIVAHGIASKINEKRAVIGSAHFVFEDENCVIPEGEQEKFDALPKEYSHLYLAIEGKLAAVICIEDPLREEASAVVQSLKRAGLSKVVMMTGDSERTAAAIAKRVGVDEYYSEVLPEDKASFVEREKAAGRKVIMIGDGINDSPALSAANVGIAISDGAEIAREIADITVSSDDLYQIVTLKLLSDSLMERIKKNYRRIVGFNSLLIVLGVTGVIQPTTSALLHNSSTLLIGLESMQNLLD